MTLSLLRGTLPCFSSPVLWRKPNAALHLPLEAGATQERRLEAVRCKRLILIEAPSPAHHGGMLIAGDYHSRVRRRPHAILYEATPILLRHRPACPHHVPLYSEPGW